MPDTRLVRSCFSGQGHRMRCGMRTCCSSGALLRPPSPALLQFLHPSAHAPIDSDKRFLIPCLSCTQLDYVPAFASAEGLDDQPWDRVRANSTATPLQHPDRLDRPTRAVPGHLIKVPGPPDAWRRRLLITQPEGGPATLARNTEAILIVHRMRPSNST